MIDNRIAGGRRRPAGSAGYPAATGGMTMPGSAPSGLRQA
jgi:hypothetical protein